MALVGGGGAGNVAGGNPAGTGQSINYLRTSEGTWVYAYSGAVSLNNETKTVLKFSIGPEVIIGKIQLTTKAIDLASGKVVRIKIYLDDQVIIDQGPGIATTLGPFDFDPLYVNIPPYSKVKVEVQSSDTSGTNFYTTLTGRLYA